MVSSRNADNDDELFEMCLSSLEEEIMFNVGHLLAPDEPPREEVDEPKPPKPCLKKKPGRAFHHALSRLYIQDSGRYGTNNKTETIQSVRTTSTAGFLKLQENKCFLLTLGFLKI